MLHIYFMDAGMGFVTDYCVESGACKEEVRLPLQPELLGVVWQLPAVAHQGGQGVCRPSLPHPPHQVIPS